MHRYAVSLEEKMGRVNWARAESFFVFKLSNNRSAIFTQLYLRKSNQIPIEKFLSPYIIHHLYFQPPPSPTECTPWTLPIFLKSAHSILTFMAPPLSHGPFKGFSWISSCVPFPFCYPVQDHCYFELITRLQSVLYSSLPFTLQRRSNYVILSLANFH